MQIWELKTKNGRVFRVAIENARQEKRLKKVIADNNNTKTYEKFISQKVITVGIHNIADFERLANTLV